MDYSFEILLFLFFVAMLAGWVDTIAGGGGLLTLPALLLCGVPPAVAIATNKMQGSSGTLIAAIYFIRKGAVRLQEMWLSILMTFLGSMLGSWLILKINSDFLLQFLPAILILVGLYFLFAPRISDLDRERRLKVITFSLLICPMLGFYDGFFGPGTGSFMALSFVTLCGYGLPKATANTKILNFTSNISALMYFILFGEMAWVVGAVMITGQMIGATLGAKMVIEIGSRLVKPVIVIVCFAMAFRILWQSFIAA
jgi:uncharacterized protein